VHGQPDVDALLWMRLDGGERGGQVVGRQRVEVGPAARRVFADREDPGRGAVPQYALHGLVIAGEAARGTTGTPPSRGLAFPRRANAARGRHPPEGRGDRVDDGKMTGVDRFDGEFDAVLAAAQRGAPAAFARIFAALSPVVVGYLRTQGAHEPDDLTSEVFVAVLRNVRRFSGDEAGFRSWVFTIAHRRLLDERRSLGRRPQFTELAAVLDRPAPEDVEAAVETSLGEAWVRELCDRLSPDQRDVLLMRLFGRLTVDEVAAALDKTPVAVKALQRRGFRAVARALDLEEVSL
jgi:RNA polymerase sigma-70 factor (ECF subfamily)